MFLNYRIYFLDNCINHNKNYVRRIFCEELPRDSPDIEELFEEMTKAMIKINNSFLKWRYKDNLEYYKYPCDFERPNNILPYEWGSSSVYWKTG